MVDYNSFTVYVSQVNPGSSEVVTFAAIFTDIVTANTNWPGQNTSIIYTSTNCDNASRSYYEIANASSIFIPNIVLSINQTSCLPGTTGTNLTIGEVVTIDGTIVFPQGSTNNVNMTIQFPKSPRPIDIISANVIGMGTLNTTYLSIFSSGLIIDTDGDLKNDTAIFYFGTVLNSYKNNNIGNSLTVQVIGYVVDMFATKSGNILVTTANVTHANQPTGQQVS